MIVKLCFSCRRHHPIEIEFSVTIENCVIFFKHSPNFNEMASIINNLENAENRIKMMNRNHLIQLSDIRDPPRPIIYVFQTLAILFHLEKNTDECLWKSARRLIRQTNIIEKILNFDKDHLTVEQIKRLEEFLKLDEMRQDHMDCYSKTAGHLLAWIIAIYRYRHLRN